MPHASCRGDSRTASLEGTCDSQGLRRFEILAHCRRLACGAPSQAACEGSSFASSSCYVRDMTSLIGILLSRPSFHVTRVTSLCRVRVMGDISEHMGSAEYILEFCFS